MLAAWVWKGLVCVEAKPAGKKKSGGVGEGRSPPPFANAILAAWVWRALVCFEASLPGLQKKKSGGGGWGTPFANAMLAAWVWKGLVCLEAKPAGKKRAGGLGGAQPPPHLQTQCSQHGFGRDSYALKQTCPAKKKELKQKNGGGGVGGRSLFLYFCLCFFPSFCLWFFLSFVPSFVFVISVFYFLIYFLCSFFI